MGIEDTKRRTWFSVVVGAVIGLALGVLVSVTADVPLAIEAGLVLGVLVGWLSRRVRTWAHPRSQADNGVKPEPARRVLERSAEE
jgi:uncharacterized membrane-anchored protein YhcB (DUF1043 family)